MIVKDRLVCGWRFTTKNFRLSSCKLLGYYGANLQNPTPALMRCVIPPDNYIFIQADQSGAEALVVAYECRRAKFRKLFELNVKPHSYTALQIFTEKFRGAHPASRYKGVDPSTLVTYPEYDNLFKVIKGSQREYDLGKRVRHARNYKMGPRTFQVNCLEMSEGSVALSFKEAKDFLSIDDEVFPEIGEWQDEIKQELLTTRTLRNLFGFPREFTGIWSESLVRDGCAFNPQSTVGCITNMAFVEISGYIKTERLPWLLLNNKHDSLLIAVPDTAEHIEHGSALLRQHLARELMSTKGEEYRMKVDISKGYNWAKYSKDNPEGMKDLA